MPNYSGQVVYPAPLSPARVVLHLTGPWPDPVLSYALIRLPSQPRLTLRCRTATDVTVWVERREQTDWLRIQEQTGSELSFLVKARQCPVRVGVQGDSPGWVELVETRG